MLPEPLLYPRIPIPSLFEEVFDHLWRCFLAHWCHLWTDFLALFSEIWPMTKSLVTPFILQILESLTTCQLGEAEKPFLLNLSSNIDKSECSWDQEKTVLTLGSQKLECPKMWSLTELKRIFSCGYDFFGFSGWERFPARELKGKDFFPAPVVAPSLLSELMAQIIGILQASILMLP